ncbi:MAG: Cys-Gln thioester bond-forming surface protein, partial [Romboutsia sp.]|nr:Cys-Gln thioester bond-forming surface protein [Romboutsia sp.]
INFELTDDDITAVQQAVIWYFTNYEDLYNGDRKYDKTDDSHWLYYTTDGLIYNSLSDYYVSVAPNPNGNKDSGAQRQEQAEILYNYLINAAKANAHNYSDISNQGEPVTVTTTENYEISGSNYIIGPLKINDNGTGIPYTIGNLTVEVNGTATTNYKLLDNNKTETNETLTQLVGENFYISVPKNGTNEVEINSSISYSTSNLTLWASTTNNLEQPVMIP